MLLRDVGDVAEAGLRELDAIGERHQPLARTPKRLGVAVEPEQASALARRAQHRLRVTTHAYCPINDPARVARSQKEHDLVDEDRYVNRYTPSCERRSKPDGNPSPF